MDLLRIRIGAYLLFKKRVWHLILIIPFLIVEFFYIRYASLDVYTYNAENNTLTVGNRQYTNVTGDSYKEFYNYNGERDFTFDKVIGKTNYSEFFGFKEYVWNIDGKPIDEVIFVKGLMSEGVFVKKK